MNSSQTVVIIPCYNEERRLPVDAFQTICRDAPGFFFVFVDDGSSDQTHRLLTNSFGTLKNTHTLRLSHNGGKAEAIREGISWASQNIQFDRVGFLDSDLATPFDQFQKMTDLMLTRPLGMVTGLRLARLGARIKRNALRHYLGRVFATLVSIMLDLPVYDTQCGAKVFRKAEAQELFREPFVSRWFFDVELFFRLKRYYSDRARLIECVMEFPLTQWTDIEGTKLKKIDFLRTPVELMRIYWAYRRWR